MAITVKVKGGDALAKAMWKAAKKYRSKSETKKITRPGAVHMRKGLRREIRTYTWKDSTGNLERSIRTFSWSKSWQYFVGPSVGDQSRHNGSRKARMKRPADGFYFGWVNFGTSRTGWGKGIRPRRIFERAIRFHGESAARIVQMTLYRNLDGLF